MPFGVCFPAEGDSTTYPSGEPRLRLGDADPPAQGGPAPRGPPPGLLSADRARRGRMEEPQRTVAPNVSLGRGVTRADSGRHALRSTDRPRRTKNSGPSAKRSRTLAHEEPLGGEMREVCHGRACAGNGVTVSEHAQGEQRGDVERVASAEPSGRWGRAQQRCSRAKETTHGGNVGGGAKIREFRSEGERRERGSAGRTV